MMTQAPTDALRLVPIDMQIESILHDLVEEVSAAQRGARVKARARQCCARGAAKNALLNLLAAAPASPLPGGGDMDWQSVAMWMGFAASVIKSGEPWSDQCQQHYDEAKAAFARLAAPTGEPK